ncbi:surface lipoprotein assembly modifier [Gallibacterium anatis]|uniref:surface lipoprotein assembly modifier n=2 Tax=Gallibacterium anatis TaxID=750 RepID=UPI0030042F59
MPLYSNMKNKFYLILLSIHSPFLLAQSSQITYEVSYLKQDQATTERLLFEMLNINRFDVVEKLLPIYQSFPQVNPELLAYTDLKLAQNAFYNHHNKEAKQRFQLLKLQHFFKKDDLASIEQYLAALDNRDSWKFSFNVHYLQTKNVNNTSNERHIENTGFVKNDDMLPQSAHGFSYYLDVQKNWNIIGSHYLYFANNLYGKNYWDNHDYDEMTNRTYFGYQYQNAKYQFGLKPFYERQWFGGHRYNWANGLRVEYGLNFSKHWQISTALEFSQPRYLTQPERNGTIKLASATLIWQPTGKGYYYLGTDFIRENTQLKQYSNDMKALRLGWRQNWGYAIASQINGSIALRQYKDFASLGNILPLDKIRRDKIYSLNLTLWKQDWQYLGFVPKVQFRWKKQNSNIPSMFSYSEKYVQLLIEKDF